MSEKEFKKYDTFARTTYFVRLAQDAKTFPRKDGKPDDVVLTFCDNSRIEGTETLWVDARVISFQGERAMKYKKGDQVQIIGKTRYKIQQDGQMRGKVYDAMVDSFVALADREAPAATGDAPPPAWE